MEVKDIDLTKVTPSPDLFKVSYESLYDIGTTFFDCDGACWKYVEVIFGCFTESHFYQWVPWNGLARFVTLSIPL